jgi:regulatory protein
MPVVTDIKRQKGKETRFNIYLDGSYSFALSDLELSTSGLRVGQMMSAEEVVEYQGQAERSRAYARAVGFVSLRPRSRRELEGYLVRKGFVEAEVKAAIERLRKLGLVDDRAFARSWIESRMAVRPRSRRML